MKKYIQDQKVLPLFSRIPRLFIFKNNMTVEEGGEGNPPPLNLYTRQNMLNTICVVEHEMGTDSVVHS